MHQVGELERLLRRQHIAVHDVERIAGLPHVQPCERAPSPSDGVEDAALAVLEQTGLLERGPDDLLRLLDRLRRDVLQGETPERQRQAALDPLPLDLGEFERAAAEVADDAIRLVSRIRHRAPTIRPRACRTGRRSWCRRCPRLRKRRPCRSWHRGRRRSRSPRAGRPACDRTGRESAATRRAPCRRHRAPTGRWSAPRARARPAPSR